MGLESEKLCCPAQEIERKLLERKRKLEVNADVKEKVRRLHGEPFIAVS